MFFISWPNITVTPKSEGDALRDQQDGDRTEMLQGIANIQNGKEDYCSNNLLCKNIVKVSLLSFSLIGQRISQQAIAQLIPRGSELHTIYLIRNHYI
jgi:hypothetical protein